MEPPVGRSPSRFSFVTRAILIGVSLWLLLTLAGFLAMAQGGRTGIDALNRSAHTIYAYEVSAIAEGNMEAMGTAVTRVAPGERAGIAAEYEPVGCWLIFLDEKTRKPLAVVQIAPEDKRPDGYVVTYPPSASRRLPVTSGLPLPWSGH